MSDATIPPAPGWTRSSSPSTTSWGEEADQTKAESEAMKKTGERDEAYDAMKDALRPIKGTLKGALRKCWPSWGYEGHPASSPTHGAEETSRSYYLKEFHPFK